MASRDPNSTVADLHTTEISRFYFGENWLACLGDGSEAERFSDRVQVVMVQLDAFLGQPRELHRRFAEALDALRVDHFLDIDCQFGKRQVAIIQST